MMTFNESNLNGTATEQSSTALLFDLPSEDKEDYIQLRAMLDSIETTVLAYYLENDERVIRHQKFGNIKSWLISVVDNCKDGEGNCPRGTYPCGTNWCCSNISIDIQE